jgi:hypothetical protein
MKRQLLQGEGNILQKLFFALLYAQKTISSKYLQVSSKPYGGELF